MHNFHSNVDPPNLACLDQALNGIRIMVLVYETTAIGSLLSCWYDCVFDFLGYATPKR